MTVCAYCEEEILPGERADNEGSDFHRECLLRSVAGSAAHQLRECTCYGGTREDPPNMSKRDAAKLAVDTYQALHPMIEFWTYKCAGCRLEMNWERERYPDGPSEEDLKICPQCDTPIDRTKLEVTKL